MQTNMIAWWALNVPSYIVLCGVVLQAAVHHRGRTTLNLAKNNVSRLVIVSRLVVVAGRLLQNLGASHLMTSRMRMP